MATKEELTPLYQQYYRRDPTAEELQGWAGYSGNDLAGAFRSGVKSNLPADAYNLPFSDMNPMGYTTMAPKDWESYIRGQYEAKMPEIESQIKGQAAGGGLDTGGYMTSLAKAKTASWSDMLANIMGYKQQQESLNWQKQLPFIQREWQTEDQNKLYQIEAAKLAASRPSDWSYILGGAAAGAPFGPIGAVIGGLAGWGAKQGFLD